MTDLEQRLVQVVPTARQVAHQQLEFYAFVHFTVNTFTGREWGDGTEDPAIFNPVKFCAKQWTDAVKAAGMKGLILTCKHHDGFCLWPSRYTRHTIAASPYRDGKGDIVREVSDACREAGLKYGVYLSPWDRNSSLYGQQKAYDDYFVNQLTELLTNYGEIFSVWFDGACGEGSNGKKQYYDWNRYYEVIRALQPNACISVCGPDVRWCGNEAGATRASEWSVVPERTRDTEKIASDSQKLDDAAFRQRKIAAQDQDLGSRSILEGEDKLIWYPAEVNTSIRPGWFYHKEEDDQVKPLSALIDIYEKSVGGNATFLLNIPPDQTGLFHENDVKRLRELGDYIRTTYADNLVEAAEIEAASEADIEPEHSAEHIRTDSYEEFFKTKDGISSCEITLTWQQAVKISHLVLKENILMSQRIEKFEIQAEEEGTFHTVYEGTVVGYKKIVSIAPVETRRIRIRILEARVAPTLSFVGAYR